MINYTAALALLKYTIVSKHKKGHGIHSPFLFDIIRKVFQDKKPYPQYTRIESYYNELREVNQKIEITEMGAGSTVFKDNARKISELVKYAGVSKKYGRLLFRLVAFFQPECVLELGSSLGISACYLAIANSDSKIISVEGDSTLVEQAKQNAKNLYLENIEFIHSSFEDYFSKTDTLNPFQFVFIDGDHSYEATIRNFNLVNQLCPEVVVVFDDINWSSGMQKAWQEICENSGNVICVDLYRFGILFKKPGITPGKFTVRF